MKFFHDLETALRKLEIGFDTKNKTKALVTIKYLSSSGQIHEADFEASTKEELLSIWKDYSNNNSDVYKEKNYVHDVSLGFTDEQEEKHKRLQIYLALFLNELKSNTSVEPNTDFINHDDKLKEFIETALWNDTYFTLISTLRDKGYDIYVPSIKTAPNGVSYVSEKFK